MAADDFEFGLGYTPGASWAEYVRRLADQRCGDRPRAGAGAGDVPRRRRRRGRSSGARRSATSSTSTCRGSAGTSATACWPSTGVAATPRRSSARASSSPAAVGVERVLVTCDEGNVGSAAVIERCGGVYESSFDTGDGTPTEAPLLDRLMGAPRRAIVVPVPPPVAASVDEIRRRFDPVMAARIDAHITLVHEVVDSRTCRRAGRRGRAAGAVRGAPDRSGAVGSGALRGVPRRRRSRRVASPRCTSALRDVETPGWARVEYRPHVTLVHGRTVTADDAELAWSALDGFVAGWEVKVSSIDVIELVEPRWELVERVEMGGAR